MPGTLTVVPAGTEPSSAAPLAEHVWHMMRRPGSRADDGLPTLALASSA